MTPLLVLSNCPDPMVAETLARTLVERRLAACVNILAPCRSVYQWQGTIEAAEEIPVLIKTTADAYPALEAAIAELHPYSVPEIIALPITAGAAPYLAWLAGETGGQV